MVHSESQSSRSYKNDLVWKFNIPFNWVSETLINQIKDRYYGYDSFLKWGEVLSALPNFWNVGLVDSSNNVYMFAYGMFNPLDSELEIKRAVIDRMLYSFRGKVLEEGLDKIKGYAKSLGLKKVYWISTKDKAFLRKMPKLIKEANVKVLEVI